MLSGNHQKQILAYQVNAQLLHFRTMDKLLFWMIQYCSFASEECFLETQTVQLNQKHLP